MAVRKKNYLNSVCLICEKHEMEPLCFMASQYCPKIFRRIVICTSCGHIQLYPIFQEQEYKVINENFFRSKYLVNGEQNTEVNKKKINKQTKPPQ